MWIVEAINILNRLSSVPPKLITIFREDNYVFLVIEFSDNEKASRFIEILKPTIDKLNKTLG